MNQGQTVACDHATSNLKKSLAGTGHHPVPGASVCLGVREDIEFALEETVRNEGNVLVRE